MHKPVSNRLLEGKAVIELAFVPKPNIVTHLIPWDSNGSMDQVMEWINHGKIGKLKELHNWTNRCPCDGPNIQHRLQAMKQCPTD